MTDYTVIRNSSFRNRSDVVVEINIPSTPSDVNAVGTPWVEIISGLRTYNGQTGSTQNPYKTTDNAYLNNLDQGEIVEVSMSISYNANLPEEEKDAIVDAAVAVRAAEELADIFDRYEFAGKMRAV